MSDPQTQNISPDPEAPADQQVDPDSESDPSLDDGEASDWSGEGGATPTGPATDSPSAD